VKFLIIMHDLQGYFTHCKCNFLHSCVALDYCCRATTCMQQLSFLSNFTCNLFNSTTKLWLFKVAAFYVLHTFTATEQPCQDRKPNDTDFRQQRKLPISLTLSSSITRLPREGTLHRLHWLLYASTTTVHALYAVHITPQQATMYGI